MRFQFTFSLKALAGLKTGVLDAANVIASSVAGFLPVESNYTERIVELFLHNPAVPTIPTLPVGSFYLNWTTTVGTFLRGMFCNRDLLFSKSGDPI